MHAALLCRERIIFITHRIKPWTIRDDITSLYTSEEASSQRSKCSDLKAAYSLFCQETKCTTSELITSGNKVYHFWIKVLMALVTKDFIPLFTSNMQGPARACTSKLVWVVSRVSPTFGLAEMCALIRSPLCLKIFSRASRHLRTCELDLLILTTSIALLILTTSIALLILTTSSALAVLTNFYCSAHFDHFYCSAHFDHFYCSAHFQHLNSPACCFVFNVACQSAVPALKHSYNFPYNCFVWAVAFFFLHFEQSVLSWTLPPLTPILCEQILCLQSDHFTARGIVQWSHFHWTSVSGSLFYMYI